jgi:glutamate 5-kinase
MENILPQTKSIVIKVGTAGITTSSGIDYNTITHLANTAYNLHSLGKSVTIVTSGAIASGRRETGLFKSPTDEKMQQKQALAAIGQAPLMHAYYEAFKKLDLIPAQLLVSKDDFEDAKRQQTLRDTYEALSRMNRVVPIINENDPIAIDEIRFTDNDGLQASIMNNLNGDVAVNLITFPGLLKNGQVAPIGVSYNARFYDDLSRDIREGRGGLQGKLDAMKLINEAGKVAIIGNVRGSIVGMLTGEYPHTRFLPGTHPLS